MVALLGVRRALQHSLLLGLAARSLLPAGMSAVGWEVQRRDPRGHGRALPPPWAPSSCAGWSCVCLQGEAIALTA